MLSYRSHRPDGQETSVTGMQPAAVPAQVTVATAAAGLLPGALTTPAGLAHSWTRSGDD
jgi:hypothetical protein